MPGWVGSIEDLLQSAEDANKRAYAPYSGFHVGAAVLTSTDRVFVGANVESAPYEVIHAEQAAIVNANAAGHRDFVALALFARRNGSDTATFTTPCGTCRQLLFEFASLQGTDIEILLATTRLDVIRLTSISALLPGAFGPMDLGIDLSKWRR